MHSTQRPDRAKIAFIMSGVLIAFAYGTAVGVFHLFPYHQLRFMAESAMTLYREIRVLTGAAPKHHLAPARRDGAGVTILDHERAAPGLTLLSGLFDDDNELRLIDLDGTVVKRWPARFHEIFPDPVHIRPSRQVPTTNWNTNIHGALALPDGSVVFNFDFAGLVKLDRCGEVEWTVPRMTHHSITMDDDGSYLVSAWRYVEDPDRSASPLWPVPHHEDLILRVSATGQVVDEISVPRLLFDNEMLGFLTAHGASVVRLRRDFIHLNDVEPLAGSIASAFPDFATGDLLISLRHLNLVAVVDPATRRIKWHHVGPWIRQHDPDFTPAGTIIVFDNRSDDTRLGTVLGGSRIVEIDPGTGILRTKYGSETGEDFYTIVHGKHQLLDNGNHLIVESLAGRAFEIDPEGEIVWEYINRYDAERVAPINDALRYSHDYFEATAWTCEGERRVR